VRAWKFKRFGLEIWWPRDRDTIMLLAFWALGIAAALLVATEGPL